MSTEQPIQVPPETAWIPDWKDKAQYPDPKGLSALFWAWEFLRRNQIYRDDWKALIFPELCKENKSHVHKDSKFWDNSQHFEQEFGLRRPLRPWLSSADLIKMQDCPLFIPAGRVRQPLVLSPKDAAAASAIFGDPDEEVDEGPYVVDTKLGPTEAVVVVDLRFPIDRQFEQAKIQLEPRIKMLEHSEQLAVWRRNKYEHYPSYLRLLDALETGATHGEMGAEIFPDVGNEYDSPKRKRMVENGLKRAKELRDRLYRWIAALADT